MKLPLSTEQVNVLDAWLGTKGRLPYACRYNHSFDTVEGIASWADGSGEFVLLTCPKCNYVEWLRWPEGLARP